MKTPKIKAQRWTHKAVLSEITYTRVTDWKPCPFTGANGKPVTYWYREFPKLANDGRRPLIVARFSRSRLNQCLTPPELLPRLRKANEDAYSVWLYDWPNTNACHVNDPMLQIIPINSNLHHLIFPWE